MSNRNFFPRPSFACIMKKKKKILEQKIYIYKFEQKIKIKYENRQQTETEKYSYNKKEVYFLHIN